MASLVPHFLFNADVDSAFRHRSYASCLVSRKKRRRWWFRRRRRALFCSCIVTFRRILLLFNLSYWTDWWSSFMMCLMNLPCSHQGRNPFSIEPMWLVVLILDAVRTAMWAERKGKWPRALSLSCIIHLGRNFSISHAALITCEVLFIFSNEIIKFNR